LSAGVCGCCGALRPRYKRLVDNIFPEDPEVRAFPLSQLHSSERVYLQSNSPRLPLKPLICNCIYFVKFANIEEDTPSYHRSYDFFVSRFSEMCHSSYEDPDIRTKIRMAGIKGLQGVVRKTVNDELQANIWDPQHMDKIVPSLLFNLQSGEGTESRSPSPLQASKKEKESPAELTERCFRELLGRAAYGNIKNAVTPVLMHLDNHSLWEGKTFAVRCFKIIMYSIQSQHSHLVIQQLLGHLDANSKSSATVRAGIVEVLLEAAAIAASGSVGPTVLEVFNTLLRHLRLSVDYELTGSYGCTNIGTKIIKEHEERQLQEAVIRTIGSFANTLPTYQRSEVMLFIMGKIPIPGMHPMLHSTGSGPEGNRMIQVMLLKSLRQVTCGFQTTNMLTALPNSFLDPLLSFALLEDAEIRLLVLEILVSLIDRHNNLPKFSTISIISDISVLKLKVDKCSRQDNLFMKKHAQHLYRHIYLCSKEQSSVQPHFEKLYSLLALISMELANEEVVVDLIRVALALQDLALSSEETLSVYNRCAVHALSSAYLNLISQLTTVPAFCQHVHEVIEMRQKESPYLLPEDRLTIKLEGELLFQQAKITEVLGGSGYNTERLATPYVPQFTDEDRLSKRKSIGETISLQVEVESRNSPEKEERTPAEEITFETLKNAIVDSVGVEEQEKERRRQVVEKFQKAPFEEIAAHCGARATMLQSKLNQIFEITIRPPPSPSGTITSSYGQTQSRSVPVYEMKFPDLCVY
uniref:EFR3 homolog Bb (S. cerevisiae) n=1 Tax=Sinocyclocheilus rhinocerous TaxID=307959 RepID=A0A673IBE6_9TELE